MEKQKKTVKKKESKIRKFFEDIKKTWKRIKFMSKKDAIKRTIVVLISIVILGLLIMGIDFIVGNGFKALSLVSLNISVAKTILTVIFSISALLVIILGVLIESKTKSFTPMTNNATYNKSKNTPQYKMNVMMVVCSMICFISAVGVYIL